MSSSPEVKPLAEMPDAARMSGWRGFSTLVEKECRRFMSVLGQTVTAPVVTALLYLLVFSHAMAGRGSSYAGVSYTQFLVPGLMMMSIIQNAFANSSSSITQSKLMGNIVFILMSPLSALDLFAAHLIAALLRSALVGLALFVATWPFVHLSVHEPLALLAVFLLSGGSLAALGLIAGVVATKFDHLAAFQNFVVMPMSFLSGVFYSVHTLPSFWAQTSRVNPFFYMIDGFRYGLLGASDVSIWTSLGWLLATFLVVSSVSVGLLHRGYRLRA